jgi:hypothetical protein
VRFLNFDLTTYQNVSVMFRFVFASDSSVQYTGHVFDNFCVYGGSIPAVSVQCQLLNPDMDGDGIRDVHAGDYLYYSATFVNMTGDPQDYGDSHDFYAQQSCPDPQDPVVHRVPECLGTLPGGGVETNYYRVRVPENNDLVTFNPWSVQVAAWDCDGGTPVEETGRCCFDVTLLKAWQPPAPEPVTGFVVEEIDIDEIPMAD